jgi:hypothetical protein
LGGDALPRHEHSEADEERESGEENEREAYKRAVHGGKRSEAGDRSS